jgi:DNA-directed RNA polymerase specialized sigma subunit
MDKNFENWSTWKKNPSSGNLMSVVDGFDGLINTSIGQQKNINRSLLKSKAKLLTIDAIKTYDPLSGANLTTHVYNYLRPINRESKDMAEVAPMSRHYSDESAKMINAVTSFAEENGREPDDSEIRDMLGISQKRLEKLNKIVKYEIPESQVIGGMEDEDTDEQSDRLNLWTDYVYHDLGTKDKKILDLKLGRNGHTEMSNEEVAIKLNTSPAEISNRSAYIASKILQGMNTKEKIIK